MFDFSMINNLDNGLVTDRLCRHIIIFLQDLSDLDIVFKAKN